MADSVGRELTRAFYDLFSSERPDRVDNILGAGWTNHPADEGRSPDVSGFLDGIQDLRTALNALRVDIEETVEQGSLIVCRIRVTGRFVGPFAGVPPTGREGSFSAMDMHRLHAGRIVETWHYEHTEQLADE
ncbi:ester cyclase [Leifsonia shinshuensis]|uniref:Ester cyclase n=1 Tax=Leifsonia shinshuensis TaxID=150026 RepID=A0A7G6YAA3_9MICO|nr:ester cyclase [Leifsonia shinshuensis]QNE35418.1 ester cyclase [Leifsonia shinshuensis]